MATRANPLKVGLFVVFALVAFAFAIATVGARKLHIEAVGYVTYFNESVAGLNVGAPVRARGVLAGQVDRIGFAPDHRMIEVWSGLNVKTLEQLGMGPPGPKKESPPAPPDLRARIASEGLLGAKFVALDFFDPAKNPAPKLSFAPGGQYIPAATSPDIQESLGKASDGLAKLIDTLNREKFPDKLSAVAGRADDALLNLDQILAGLRREDFSHQTGAAIAELREAIQKVHSVLGRLDGDQGLLAATQRTVVSFGEVGRNAGAGTRNLEDVLEEVRAMAASIRLLADELERDPDMLLKGRARATR
jgi:ABC-type transporter Mla subunit MlaD